MRCIEFLRAYSDYRDGLITDARTIVSVREHLAACARCRRYDRTIARGVSTLRAGGVDPDPSVAARFHGVAVPAALVPPVPAHASVFAAALVVAAFGLIAWDAVRGTSAAARAPAPPTATAAPPVVVANPGVPFIRFADFAPRDEPPAQVAELAPVASSLTLYQGTPDR